MRETFSSFEEFYPYYLDQHQHPTSRILHAIGTAAALIILLSSLWRGYYPGILLALIVGYGLAWAGHFFFEKNRPATFQHPLYSLMGDFRLMYEMFIGQKPET